MTASEEPEREYRSLTRSTVHGVFWITAGRFLKAPLNLVALAVLARLLTPSDFGVVAIAMLVASFSDVIVDGSFGMVLIQRRQVDPELVGASLLLSALLAGLFAASVIFGAPFIEREFDFPELGRVLLFIGATLPITAATTITTALMQRSFQFGALTLNAVVSQLVYTLAAIGLAFAGAGLWSLVWAQILSLVTQSLMGFLVVRKRYSVALSGAAIRDVLGSGGMFTVSKLLNWASNGSDRLVIGRFLGAAELGFYTRVATLMRTAGQLTGAGPLRVLFSSFAKIQHDKPRLRSAYFRALSLSLVAGTTVSAFVAVNSELIVRVLLGPRWLTTIPVMQILFAAFMTRMGSAVAESVPLALGLSGASAARQGVQLVLVVAGAAIGVSFGLVGAAWGVFAAYWLSYIVCLALVERLLGARWWEVVVIHLKAFAVVAPSVLLALAARSAIGDHGVALQLVPAAVFALAAAIVLGFGPAALVTGDLVRARGHAWGWLSPRLPGRRNPDAA